MKLHTGWLPFRDNGGAGGEDWLQHTGKTNGRRQEQFRGDKQALAGVCDGRLPSRLCVERSELGWLQEVISWCQNQQSITQCCSCDGSRSSKTDSFQSVGASDVNAKRRPSRLLRSSAKRQPRPRRPTTPTHACTRRHHWHAMESFTSNASCAPPKRSTPALMPVSRAASRCCRRLGKLTFP